MNVLILSALLAIAAAEKLDNTYLPPSNAKTAGGSGAFLTTPLQQESKNPHKSSLENFKRFEPAAGQDFARGHSKLAPTHQDGQDFPRGHSKLAPTHQDGQDFPRGHSKLAPTHQDGASSGPQTYSSPHHEGKPVAILRLDNENIGDGSYRFEYETENKITQQETGQLKNIGGEEATVVHGSYSYISPEGQQITVNYIADENGFQPIGDHLPTPPPVPEAILRSLQKNAEEEAKSIKPGYPDSNLVRPGNNEAFSHENNGPSGGNAGYFNKNNIVINNDDDSIIVNRQYVAPNKPHFNQKEGYKY